MVKPKYIPDRGDIVRISFDPTLGHEQAKLRPALVLSPQNYNKSSSLILCCPITSKIKGYPFEVPLNVAKITGAILSDQVRTLDWQAREVTKLAKVDQTLLDLVAERLMLLIGSKS